MDQEQIVWSGPSSSNVYERRSLGRMFYDFLETGNPEDVILVDIATGEEITKKQYLTCSIKLANYLRSEGISRGDIIGVISPNTWKFLVPILSAFYLGATLTFSNPKYLEDDLRHFLEISQPRVLFISQCVKKKIQPLLKDFPCVRRVIILHENNDAEEVNLDGIINENNTVDNDMELISGDLDEDVAFLLFSSGTTGMPKGVLITHKAVKHALNVITDPQSIGIGENSIIIQVLPLFHMYGLLMALLSLTQKTKLILLENFKPEVFLKTVQDFKVTCLILVPALLQFLAKTPLLEHYNLSSIEDILCSSAPIGKEVEELVNERVHISPRQGYGATEAGGFIACLPRGRKKSGSVGTLVPGVQVKIVDHETGKQLSGAHKTGEICVKSIGIMKGYINNEEQTRKDIDEQGYLHTGDLGYFDHECYLFIVGRIKEVIKYKGFQVAPAQLENILFQHPAVKDVAVMGKPDDRVGELPTAFVVKHQNRNVSVEELIDFVKERVHVDKQLHGGVIFTDDIPRNAVQKIDRKKLCKMFW